MNYYFNNKLDEDGCHHFFARTKLPSGFTLELRGYQYLRGSSLYLSITLLVARKRRRLSEGLLGQVSGPGGLEVYKAVSDLLDPFAQSILGRHQTETTALRLVAVGYNNRLHDTYVKVLPRLGFKPELRGYRTMERLISKA